jgi:hypothetical protein
MVCWFGYCFLGFLRGKSDRVSKEMQTNKEKIRLPALSEP